MRHLILMLTVVVMVYTSSVAQGKQEDVHITINGSASINGTRFTIDVYRRNGNIKIGYSLFDSLQRSALMKDEYAKDFMSGQRFRDSTYTAKLMLLFSKYEVYSRDTIQINEKSDTAYCKLLSRLSNSTAAQLTIHNRYGLDGISVSVLITTANSKVKLSTWTPNKDSNPEIYQLITRSFDIYRERRHNSFLDKHRTFNY